MTLLDAILDVPREHAAPGAAGSHASTSKISSSSAYTCGDKVIVKSSGCSSSSGGSGKEGRLTLLAYKLLQPAVSLLHTLALNEAALHDFGADCSG